MVMARYAYREQAELLKGDRVMTGPSYLAFVYAVNDVRPGTFGSPDNRDGDGHPFPGLFTEFYSADGTTYARIIFPDMDRPDDEKDNEGIRIVADTPDVADAFRRAARALGITLAG